MFNYNWQKKTVAVTPIMSLIVFLSLQLIWGIGNEAWLVFLAIPLMPFLVGLKKFQITFPIIILIAYLILGLGFELWHPGWIIFLLIPAYYIITAPNPQDKINKAKSKYNDTIDAEIDDRN